MRRMRHDEPFHGKSRVILRVCRQQKALDPIDTLLMSQVSDRQYGYHFKSKLQ